MRVLDIEQGSTEWMSFREGKITGTSIGKLYAKSRKIDELYDVDKPLLGFYEKVAERLAVGTADDGDENAGLGSTKERGKALEAEAVNRTEEELGLELIHGNVWISDEDGEHIESPDAYTKDLKTAVEIKCLSSGRHIMAIATGEPPKEYMAEYLNYFLVNEELERLHVVLYDPRFILPHLQFADFIIERSDVAYEIERMRDIKQIAHERIEQTVRALVNKE